MLGSRHVEIFHGVALNEKEMVSILQINPKILTGTQSSTSWRHRNRPC
jgi:hypothetical protein